MSGDVAKDVPRRNKGWDNLIPCKPGERRNPAGRPRRPSFTEMARTYLGGLVPGQTERTRMQLLIEALYHRSLKGDMKACKLLLERVDPARLRVDRSELRVLSISITRQNDTGLDAARSLEGETKAPGRLLEGAAGEQNAGT